LVWSLGLFPASSGSFGRFSVLVAGGGLRPRDADE